MVHSKTTTIQFLWILNLKNANKINFNGIKEGKFVEIYINE